MNNIDKQYCDLLREIIEDGEIMDTRAGSVRCLFDRSMRFNLWEGIPLLTTKKVFTKGIIYELCWFLSGSTNIKYLVDNNVNIWTDDAFRWFKTEFKKLFTWGIENEEESDYIWVGEKNDQQIFSFECFNEFVDNMSKEEFVERVKDGCCMESNHGRGMQSYVFGDLGPVYGQQWRSFGRDKGGFDQIKDIIDKLRNNPFDRRIILAGWNPDVLGEVALPACHMMANFHVSQLSEKERVARASQEKGKILSLSDCDQMNYPKHKLNCSFFMRSNDFCCGNPYNIAQYAMLVYILCKLCNMSPGELVFHGVNVHVYENHIEAAKTQLTRDGSEIVPKFKIIGDVKELEDITPDKLTITDYHPDAAIKYELNVG